MNNEDIFDELEYIEDSLSHIISNIDEKGNKVVLKKALELINAVTWQYEEDE